MSQKTNQTGEVGRAIQILLNGCNGRMGQVFSRVAARYPDVVIAAGLDIAPPPGPAAGGPPPGAGASYPVYREAAEIRETVIDVIVDFSHPSALDAVLALAADRGIPAVLATTGYSDPQLAAISQAAAHTPIFQSANMSVGINLMAELIRKAASALAEGFDIELIEKHHNQKVDAPSGTALLLADAMNDELSGDRTYTYDRHSVRAKRGKKEIGIHAVRGGTIVGEHTVLFAGNDEILEIRHSSASREIFAEGALRAARFMTVADRAPGRYSMSDILNGGL
ncbi:MAG: 4-hydroxy-tetrahydrodipicolinate reductase [Clostridiales bacterium]|jgi:4-hydroxy-tetrahydrodipicolinate reductase|nr:4-hydroxy-tetrahydrodipicolinate reductase [Clostridiales bacterium]